MPFARVAAEWTSDNQTVPDAVAQKLSRRSEPSTVRGITLDTQFHKVNPSKCVTATHGSKTVANISYSHGQVSMLIQGATGLNSTNALPVPSNSTLNGRSLFGKITSSISSLLKGSCYSPHS